VTCLVSPALGRLASLPFLVADSKACLRAAWHGGCLLRLLLGFSAVVSASFFCPLDLELTPRRASWRPRCCSSRCVLSVACKPASSLLHLPRCQLSGARYWPCPPPRS